MGAARRQPLRDEGQRRAGAYIDGLACSNLFVEVFSGFCQSFGFSLLQIRDFILRKLCAKRELSIN